MKAKTERLLYQLLWTGEALTRPTFRNLSGSFESWAYRNGLLRRLWELERAEILESEASPSPDGKMDRVHRLTAAGRLIALGGRDPIKEWERAWDGRWRMILFDLPESERAERNTLRRKLRAERFGCLQRSLWISPDPMEALRQNWQGEIVDTKTIIFMEGIPCGGENNSDMIAGAWDFAKIDTQYGELVDHLHTLKSLGKTPSRPRLLKWIETERTLWNQCLATDPMLPSVLLPPEYQGRIAWDLKMKSAAQTKQLILSVSDL